MIKFEVKHKLTGEVKFIAEIDCEVSASNSIKLGLAVKWGIKNEADLRSANLNSADLSEANLSYANLRYADLSEANLSYANLHSTNLSYADLHSTNLSYADLSYANLHSTNLSYANLRYTDLHSTNLSYANLRYTDLSYANLSYANLRYTDLSYAKHIIIPISVNGLGKECRTGYAIWHDDKKDVYVRLGCFWGTEKEALVEISKKYGSKSGYYQIVKGACLVARERKVLNPTEEE